MLTQGTRVLDTNSLAIETTAKLDLNDNDLIVRSGNLTTVTGQIKTGLENGGSFDWKGLGIGSTRRRPERDGGYGLPLRPGRAEEQPRSGWRQRAGLHELRDP